MNLLFICSRNQWRSRTAETIFRKSKEHSVKSAGTAVSARVKINQKLIDWANLIFVMEQKHQEILMERFDCKEKEIIVLDIPDHFHYMDTELVKELEETVPFYL